MDYRTQTFHNLRNELNQQALAGKLTKQDAINFLKEKDVDPSEFKKAWVDYKTEIQEKGEIEKPGVALGRLAGRSVGELGKGIVDLGALVVPEQAEKTIERIADAVGEKLPGWFKDDMSQLFDPYHGEGLIEPMAAVIAPYILPGTWGVKGAKAAYGVIGGLGKAAPILHKTKGLSRAAAKKSMRRTRRKEFITQTAGWGGAVTLIDGPEEDIITSLIEEHPESTKLLKFLAVNPDNPEALQYLQSLINNLSIEAPLVAGTQKLYKPYRRWAKARNVAKSARMMDKSTTNSTLTPLSKLNKWAKRNMTSRFGVDGTLLGMGLRRIYAGNRSVSEANGYAEDLRKIVQEDSKRTGISTEEADGLVNKGLEGDQEAMQLLEEKGFEKTIPNIIKLRDLMDDLSVRIGNDLVTGDLSIKILTRAGEKGGQFINVNGVRQPVTGPGVYMNHAYRMFDDPSFEAWQKIDPTVKAKALSYIKRFGINDADAEWVLQDLLYNTSQGDFKKGIQFLSDVAQTSNKPFLERAPLDASIKALMGQIRDPYKNFARTYEKLSIAKAEADFLKGVEQHLLKNNLAMVGKKIRHVPGVPGGERFRAPEEAIERGMVSLEEISENRLKKIIGENAVRTFQGKNPLKNLYVDENYAKFLEEGIDLASPTQPWVRNWMKLKSTTQTAKTVGSVATHFRNVFGNMILMIANGYNPVRKYGGPLDIVKKRLMGLSDEEFGKLVGRYQELGIADSSVRAQTVKAQAGDAFKFGPGTRAGQLLDTKVGRAGKKVFEVYQAEDDFFKIMHFEKTKADMRKWLPDISETQLENMAAERTRDLMPNYALVPKKVKMLRRMPLSDFAAWPAEVTRVTKNLLKYTMEDLTGRTAAKLRAKGFKISKEGERALKGQAATRAGGIVSMGIAGDYISGWSRNIMNISEDDQNAINRLSAPWAQNSAKIYLSPINEDKNGHVGVDFINLGPIDPFSFLKMPARMLGAALASGEDIDKGDYSRLGLTMLQNLAGPFIDQSMAFEGISDIGRLFSPEGREEISKGGGYTNTLLRNIYNSLEPGTLTMGRKQWEYSNPITGGKKALGEQHGRGAMSRFGYTMPEVEFGFEKIDPSKPITSALRQGMLLRWAGIRPQRLDISAGMRRELLPLVRDINNSPAIFTSAIGQPTGVTKEDSIAAFKKANKSKLRSFQQLRSLTSSYDQLLRDSNLRHTNQKDKDRAIYNGITKDGALDLNPNLFEFMEASRRNQFIPVFPTGQAEKMQRLYSKADIPWDELLEYYRKLKETTISD
jgi:hypothetical protein